MANQKSIGVRVMAFGKLLLFAMFLLCIFDAAAVLIGFNDNLLVPLYGYLAGIFTGVAMQFVGAAIPHMRFTPAK